MIADSTREVLKARPHRSLSDRIVEAIELADRMKRRVDRRIEWAHRDRTRKPDRVRQWLREARHYARRATRLRNYVERTAARWASLQNFMAEVQGVG